MKIRIEMSSNETTTTIDSINKIAELVGCDGVDEEDMLLKHRKAVGDHMNCEMTYEDGELTYTQEIDFHLFKSTMDFFMSLVQPIVGIAHSLMGLFGQAQLSWKGIEDLTKCEIVETVYDEDRRLRKLEELKAEYEFKTARFQKMETNVHGQSSTEDEEEINDDPVDPVQE